MLEVHWLAGTPGLTHGYIWTRAASCVEIPEMGPAVDFATYFLNAWTQTFNDSNGDLWLRFSLAMPGTNCATTPAQVRLWLQSRDWTIHTFQGTNFFGVPGGPPPAPVQMDRLEILFD